MARLYRTGNNDHERVSVDLGPSASLFSIDGGVIGDPSETINRNASVHIHGGVLPEILQDIYECPSGLEALAATDFVTVDSQLDPEDVLMGYDSDYRYQILNHADDRIFLAGKISSWRKKHMLWRSNSYEIHVMNFDGGGVFSISCKGSCCNDVVNVYMEDGLLGTLVDGCKCFPSVEIKDDEGKVLLKVGMTSCPCCNCYSGPASFEIKISGTKMNIGKIVKLDKNATHVATERYSVNFRKDINVRVKVMIIAALFHVGIRYLNTRYQTLERRIHADIVQDEGESTDIIDAIEDGQNKAALDAAAVVKKYPGRIFTEMLLEKKDTDKDTEEESEPEHHHRKHSGKDKEEHRKHSGEHHNRKSSGEVKPKKAKTKKKLKIVQVDESLADKETETEKPIGLPVHFPEHNDDTIADITVDTDPPPQAAPHVKKHKGKGKSKHPAGEGEHKRKQSGEKRRKKAGKAKKSDATEEAPPDDTNDTET